MNRIIQDILKRIGSIEVTFKKEPNIATPKFDALRKLGKTVIKEDKDNNTLNDNAEKAYKSWKKKREEFSTYLNVLDKMYSNAIRSGDSLVSNCDR
ncbi:MAG: hypothetical protein AAFR79_07380 [Pseudomonadota bacterium]